jgi:hypothetical protein
LIDNQIDWGQDLLLLRDWVRAHPETEPLRVAYFGPVSPRTAGIEFVFPAPWPRNEGAATDSAPAPGWYAISTHFAHGGGGQTFDEHGELRGPRDSPLRRFRQFDPTDRIGYSILIYHFPATDSATRR